MEESLASIIARLMAAAAGVQIQPVLGSNALVASMPPMEPSIVSAAAEPMAIDRAPLPSSRVTVFSNSRS